MGDTCSYIYVIFVFHYRQNYRKHFLEAVVALYCIDYLVIAQFSLLPPLAVLYACTYSIVEKNTSSFYVE